VVEHKHAMMLEEVVLIGLAMPKTTLVKISRSVLETFTDAVILTGEEAAAYKKADL